MAKVARAGYVCQSCGAVSARWVGKCPGLRRMEHARRGGARHPSGRPGQRPDIEGAGGGAAEPG